MSYCKILKRELPKFNIGQVVRTKLQTGMDYCGPIVGITSDESMWIYHVRIPIDNGYKIIVHLEDLFEEASCVIDRRKFDRLSRDEKDILAESVGYPTHPGDDKLFNELIERWDDVVQMYIDTISKIRIK